MARQVLPTNFKDDVLADSMGGKRRYILTENADGTFSLEDATTYTQVGDVFGAARLNAICKAVNESVDQAKVVDNVDDIKAITQPGYVPGTLPLKQVISDLASAKSNFQAGCSTIAAAITAMGVSTASNATPATMAANIKKIKTAPEYMDVEIVCNASSSSSTAGGINNISGTIFKSVSILSGSGHVLNLDTSLEPYGYVELSQATGKSYTLTSGKAYDFTVGHVGNNSTYLNIATLRFYFR